MPASVNLCCGWCNRRTPVKRYVADKPVRARIKRLWWPALPSIKPCHLTLFDLTAIHLRLFIRPCRQDNQWELKLIEAGISSLYPNKHQQHLKMDCRYCWIQWQDWWVSTLLCQSLKIANKLRPVGDGHLVLTLSPFGQSRLNQIDHCLL